MRYYLAWWLVCIPFGHSIRYPTEAMAPYCYRCDRYWGMGEDG